MSAANDTVPGVLKIDDEERFRRHKAAYWIEDIGDKLSPDMRHMLETYSGIPPEQVEKHLYEVVRVFSI